jgi:hypothetical protein
MNTSMYHSVTEDNLVWTKENNGEYSICSAYQLCMQDLLDINHFRVDGVWDLICRLKVPPKATNFIWRVCRNCLPTRIRLRDKGVNCPSNCALCDSNDEDSLHLIFKYPNSCNIWSICSFHSAIDNTITQEQAAPHIVFHLLLVL